MLIYFSENRGNFSQTITIDGYCSDLLQFVNILDSFLGIQSGSEGGTVRESESNIRNKLQRTTVTIVEDLLQSPSLMRPPTQRQLRTNKYRLANSRLSICALSFKQKQRKAT